MARVRQRGHELPGPLGRAQRGQGGAHDPAGKDDDLSELQIIAPNQRAVVGRLR